MNPKVQRQIDQFKKIAASQKAKNGVKSSVTSDRADGLSAAIHSKRDAVNFMAELNHVIKQAQ